jgi:hypothetical protein
VTTFLRFTDHEGDPLAITNEVSAVYLTRQKDTISSFPGHVVATAVKDEFTVIHHRTGNYRVRDSFEDVMAKIEMHRELEEMSRADSGD